MLLPLLLDFTSHSYTLPLHCCALIHISAHFLGSCPKFNLWCEVVLATTSLPSMLWYIVITMLSVGNGGFVFCNRFHSLYSVKYSFLEVLLFYLSLQCVCVWPLCNLSTCLIKVHLLVCLLLVPMCMLGLWV